MEDERFKKIVKNLADNLKLEIGINPSTGEEGIKINEIPTEMDVEFIKLNKEKIILALKSLKEDEKAESKIEVENEIEVKLLIKESVYKKLLKNSEEKNLNVEEYILSVLSEKI